MVNGSLRKFGITRVEEVQILRHGLDNKRAEWNKDKAGRHPPRVYVG
jgi:hypothetical protein